MSCEWQEKIALYVDDELDRAAQQDIATHLHRCPECAVAAAEQADFKKSLRIAGRRFAAPPELRAAIYKDIHGDEKVSPLWKWGFAAVCVALMVAISAALFMKQRESNPMLAMLVDQHIIASSSTHPFDVLSSDRHTVKPWFQGRIPFSFNLPDVENSGYTLLGGNLVYAQQSPVAQLVYQIRQHRISVFIFQPNGKNAGNPRDFTFTTKSWLKDALQYYLVTDATPDEANRLASLFEQSK